MLGSNNVSASDGNGDGDGDADAIAIAVVLLSLRSQVILLLLNKLSTPKRTYFYMDEHVPVDGDICLRSVCSYVYLNMQHVLLQCIHLTIVFICM